MTTTEFLSNDYLNARNQNNFRGHSEYIRHPLYQEELRRGVHSINEFLNRTVLLKAALLRQKTLYSISAEKCFKNSANNYSFSESLACEDLLLKNDPVLNHINRFNQHVEVRLHDEYEKTVDQLQESQRQAAHRKFMLRMNYLHRFWFYYQAKNLFIDNLKL